MKFSRIFEYEAIQKVHTCVNVVDLVKSFQTSIYYLVVLFAKIGVDTAENGPLKVCQKN